MSDQIPASPGEDGSTPVPRDLPDQQANGEEDRWDLEENENGETAGPPEQLEEKPTPEEPSG
ncbi:hypothetical protein [Streptomyces sp. NPDC048436]|uniref:hypothetical protein n=1 Tax=Streptomyces sp. NPDC048436 TaxID=3365550 RepID=UPI003724C2A6